MPDELKLIQDRAEGMRAGQLLRDEMVQAAFRALEADYLKVWAATTHDEWRTRETMWRAIQILGDVQSHLMTLINNGQIADKELAILAQKSTRTA